MIINPNGYYASPAKIISDWHAGIKMEKKVYDAFWFNENMEARIKSQINNPIFSKQEFLNKDYFGLYRIEDDEIIITFDKGSKFEYIQKFKIIDPKLILHENKKEYNFVAWPHLEEEE